MTSTARKLRGELTEAEKSLWMRLRASQVDRFKFVRQFPIGPHIVDFACRSVKLVVELDGGQHATDDTDPARTRIIEAYGYHVIRFWNHEVLNNMDGVLDTIQSELRLASNRLP
ncbi:DUF559 domain-containing protein [Sphingobium sp. CR2-8]|uniref:endonuclease domain-containing protein n=1 Tax=Sphingobium sp. CR2-8 TaxID=1306534 RepID=UPI002DBC1BB4|nr:DUF559 domain-containing protein [Sphingobium sp. CR2-8]MEC3910878.1 DUF559 domain-containing protein [Sphingobium sp. CR2-8]